MIPIWDYTHICCRSSYKKIFEMSSKNINITGFGLKVRSFSTHELYWSSKINFTSLETLIEAQKIHSNANTLIESPSRLPLWSTGNDSFWVVSNLYQVSRLCTGIFHTISHNATMLRG